MKMLPANKPIPPVFTKFTSSAKCTGGGRLAAMLAALAICGHALAQTPLEIYDASIAADQSLAAPLIPAATLTTPVVLTGTSGAAFDFGATSGDVAMEFILKGNPAASSFAFLAVGTNPNSRLMYQVWPSNNQLGFTQGGVGGADYRFTPGVPSPTNDTHLAFVWDSTNLVMQLYVNGTLAGSVSNVSSAFAMPSGLGWLGASSQSGSDGMVGTISRVTVYSGKLPVQAIKRHSSAFGAPVLPALAAYDTVITNDVASAGLTPTAMLTSSLVLNGSGGTIFDFGASGADGTMEFIVEGDPTTANSVFLAMGSVTTSSLRYGQWKAKRQLGFTENSGPDYLFTPGVPSPTLATHITYAWNSATSTMKCYVNGVLAGTTTGVSALFVMPSGLGRLGDNGVGSELLSGTIYRVTAYDSLLTEAAILRHGKAFGDLLGSPTIISFTATPAAITAGQSATLSWAVKNASKVLLDGIDRTGVTNWTVSPQISTRYTLTAQNALGATTSQIRLLVNPDLGAYDAAITADAAGGLVPLAMLTNEVQTSGIGVPFNFGTNSGDATMEFIVEGDPNPGAGTSLAVDYDAAGNWRNSLRYSQWPTPGQLGYSLGTAGDYVFTPVVPSPSWPTHITFVWDATAVVMKVYINGSLAGEDSTGDPTFGLPTGQGTIGRDGMVGTIFRITSYSGKVPETTILSHGKAFLGAARPALNAYDNAIRNSSAGGLNPVAQLFAPVILTGARGVDFYFGANSGDATMEFIVEGDPTTANSVFLAMGSVTTSSLRYGQWKATRQLGFTENSGPDYLFTPGVPSPTLATHITFAWNSATSTMKCYVNGVLAGTTTGVSGLFVMPSGLGRLGDDGVGSELLSGTIYRVTAYDSLLTDAAILSHGMAFAPQPPAVSLNRADGMATIVLSQGISGAHYRVEYRNTLSAADPWQLLQDIPTLVGTTTNVPDPTPIANRAYRFYHAVLVP